MDNYNILHCHTDLSNGTTIIDSVSKYTQYIDRAKELDMKAIAFTEHGNIFCWFDKKTYCEKQGIKYIHGVEMYFTATLDEKIRDNYHVCLYAKNTDGFKELNKLVSSGYNRDDNHFYYVPRISFEQLKNTSNNIIISTACIGGGFKKSSTIQKEYIEFLSKNKHRCFLEVQHHLVEEQIEYNNYIKSLSYKYEVPLIIATDTHALNDLHAECRLMLQATQNDKSFYIENEDGWDLTFKTFDELKSLFAQQGVLTEDEFYKAIANTHKLADMIEEYKLDLSYKYPKLYDNSLDVLKQKINEGIKKRGVDKLPNFNEYIERINIELDTYIHNNAIDYLLLDEDLKSKVNAENIFAGCSRGSVSGSLIAYLIGITDMDSIKHGLNFARFMNSERVSLADIDKDFSPKDRDCVKDILYSNDKYYCSEIITFNTVKTKGAIRSMGRALGIELSTINEICKLIDNEQSVEQYEKEYEKLFKYSKTIEDVVMSVGVHPCGTIVSPIPLDENVGLVSIKTCTKPVAMISSDEVNELFFVKLDILGLDNIELINKTCELAGIDRLTPDNVNVNDEQVWKAIRDNTLGVFQWGSQTGQQYIKQLFSDTTIQKIKNKFNELGLNFSYMDLLSVGNGAIRPGGASYREQLAKGEFYDNGHDGINKLLAPTLGFCTFQESLMDFLVQFCGYTKGESDIVRRAIAKKKDSTQYVSEIKRRFLEHQTELSKEKAEEVIDNFVQVVYDASDYMFSLNHSKAYSYIGYMCGWLREYYPLEFLTVALNNATTSLEKTENIINYAKQKNIHILPPTFGKSKGEYFYDKSTNTIYKGISSIKYLNTNVAEILYNFAQKYQNFTYFHELLWNIKDLPITSKHIEVLILIGYFKMFGNRKKLMNIWKIFQFITSKKQFKINDYDGFSKYLLEKHAEIKTTTLYKSVDIDGLMTEVETSIPNIEYNGIDIIQFELMYMGSSNYFDSSIDNNIYIVTHIQSKYPYNIILYHVASGGKLECKTTKVNRNKVPLKELDVIRVTQKSYKNHMLYKNGEWIATNEQYISISYIKL